MLRCLPPLVLISGMIALAQVHEVYYQGDLAPLNIAPTFNRGYLVVYDRDRQIAVFGPDGALLYRAAVRVPGAKWGDVENADVDADGTMAAAVRAISNSEAAGRGGIALFHRDGTQIRYFETRDFLPTEVAFGPDGAIWTVGWLGESRARLTEDYPILRKYSRDGTELGRFLPRASFPAPDDPLREPLILPVTGLWRMRVENRHVEVMLHRQGIWVQTDLDGKETGRWDVGFNGFPRAITGNGQAWRVADSQLQIFNRSSGAWQPAPFTAPGGSLLGADGNNLVFELSDHVALRWVPVPEAITSQTRR